MRDPFAVVVDDYYSIRAPSSGASITQSLDVLRNDALYGDLKKITGFTPYVATARVGSPGALRGSVQISSDRQSIIYSATYNGQPYTDIFSYWVSNVDSAQVVVAVGE
jgi:hypothetical protein